MKEKGKMYSQTGKKVGQAASERDVPAGQYKRGSGSLHRKGEST